MKRREEKICIVLNIINSHLKKYEKVLTYDDIDKPLTGLDIFLTGYDLFEIYLEISKYFSKKIKLKSYYDFYTIKNIVELL